MVNYITMIFLEETIRSLLYKNQQTNLLRKKCNLCCRVFLEESVRDSSSKNKEFQN
jgi:hypothetical protein